MFTKLSSSKLVLASYPEGTLTTPLPFGSKLISVLLAVVNVVPATVLALAIVVPLIVKFVVAIEVKSDNVVTVSPRFTSVVT